MPIRLFLTAVIAVGGFIFANGYVENVKRERKTLLSFAACAKNIETALLRKRATLTDVLKSLNNLPAAEVFSRCAWIMEKNPSLKVKKAFFEAANIKSDMSYAFFEETADFLEGVSRAGCEEEIVCAKEKYTAFLNEELDKNEGERQKKAKLKRTLIMFAALAAGIILI